MSSHAINPAQPQVVLQNYFTLVNAIASKIKRRLPAHVDVEDLVQTGMIGLLEASHRFDASRMVNFASYATSRITGAILDELRKWDPCSRQDRRRAREIESARQSLRATSGCEPGRAEVAAAVGLALEEYEQILHRLESGKQPSLPSDDPNADASEELERIPSKDMTPYDACSRKEDFALLREYLERLKPRQSRVLRLYYFGGLGLKEIGAQLGVGEARVSQIHKQAISEIRRMMATEERESSKSPSSMVQ